MIRAHRRQARAWLVLLIAIGAVLGHVCMMPFHAHADDTASATPGAGGGHDDSDDRAVYCASCEALRSAEAELAPSALMAWTLTSPVLPHVRAAARLPAPAFRAESPPLFLLHAALLI